MKNLILVALCLVGNFLFSQKQKLSTNTYPLEDMITTINNSLSNAKSNLKDSTIEIQKAEIALETSYDTSAGGEFKLFVKASKKWQLQKANTIKYVYEKSSIANLKSDNKKNLFHSFEDNLTKAIVKAATQWLQTKRLVNGLDRSEFSVEISFMVKKITSAGVEFEIWGLGADIGGEYENSAVHTVTLTFK